MTSDRGPMTPRRCCCCCWLPSIDCRLVEKQRSGGDRRKIRPAPLLSPSQSNPTTKRGKAEERVEAKVAGEGERREKRGEDEEAREVEEEEGEKNDKKEDEEA